MAIRQLSMTHTEFKQLLNKELSPSMAKRGLQYDGQYTWFGEMENNMRKSVSVYLLKGASAIFRWSVTFDFIPWPSGNRLVYSKTDKIISPHLYEYPIDFYKSFESENGNKVWRRSPCKMTMMGKDLKEIVGSIHTAFSHDLKHFDNWHSEFTSINDAIRMASTKISPNGEPLYPFFYPSPIYVKAFLLAAAGDKDMGMDLLEQYLLNENDLCSSWSNEIKSKLKRRLDDIKI